VETDVLGPPYERRTIDLGTDDEGPVVATLVRRRAGSPSRRAVLYVHGFVDYFFQTHLADFFVERGWNFYAIDLRKYGRSLLPHQTPNFCRSLAEYFPDLDEAMRIIREDDGHDLVLVSGHSTGGLITPLWAHTRRTAGLVDGLFLNSPFFDFNAPWFTRRPAAAAVAGIGRRFPYRVMPFGLSPVYGQSLHADHRGEWRYELAWKPLAGFPVRAGWLRAIREAQRKLRAGLEIPAPILLACSTESFRGTRWHDSAHERDAVLDVRHMLRWAPGLGRHVTIIQIEGGRHDLTLSQLPARERLFSEADRWIGAYVAPARSDRPRPAAATDHPPAAAAGRSPAAAGRSPAAAEAAGHPGETRPTSPDDAPATPG
jgi:alpha-beta hydrolase superfamily lysophospholipase